MALTNLQKNIVDKMADCALQQLQLMAEYNAIVQMYGTEGLGSILDADLQALPELAHVTASELQAAKVAIDALNTSLGNYAANSNSAKLARIIKNIP